MKNLCFLLLLGLGLTACNALAPHHAMFHLPSGDHRLNETHLLGKWLVMEASTPTCQEITTFLPNHTWLISSKQSKTAGIWAFNANTQQLMMRFTDSNLRSNCEDEQLSADDFNQMKGIDALHRVYITPKGLRVEALDENGNPNSNDSYTLKKLP